MTILRSIDPTTDEIISEHESFDDDRVAREVLACTSAQRAWSQRSVAERVLPLRELARLLRDEASANAHLMAREMGKILAQGRAEAEKCAQGCDYYAAHAEQFDLSAQRRLLAIIQGTHDIVRGGQRVVAIELTS